MIVIADCETNGLENPDRLWLVVCKEVDTGKLHIFREPDRHPNDLLEFAKGVTCWVGHNFLGFDYRHINRLCPGINIDPASVIDTLVCSRTIDATRDKHSLESYGEEFGFPKLDFNDFSALTEEMVTYCIRDVELNHKVFDSQKKYIFSPIWKDAFRCEHDMVLVCNDMQANGFYFNIPLATELLNKVSAQVSVLAEELQQTFPPLPSFIRVVEPRATKFGTLNRSDFRWLLKTGDTDLSPYSVDAPFSRIEWIPFNPGSPLQVVRRLNAAGWRPTEKTKGHFKCQKEYERKPTPELRERLEEYAETGWSISETNLSTLPEDAPEAAKGLAKYLLLASRQRLLTDWLNRVQDDGRIHANFNHIGAWTQRMSHSEPNMANVPTEKPQDAPDIAELNNTLRSLFCVPKDRLLIGVDADSIQLRILAHYMGDDRFTAALTKGDKSAGTDVHSLNAKALGPVCQGRRDAKTFIYAWLLGAGIARVAEILACSYEEAKQAREDFLNYYPGLAHLRNVVIPTDAALGYFQGLDGRFVKCYGEDEGQRCHYMLGGYLQNGESIIMKRACLMWRARLRKEQVPFWQVNFVHDEWQTETVNDLDTAKYIANVQAESIKLVGEELGLKCPMAGAILNAHEKLAISTNWRDTH